MKNSKLKKILVSCYEFYYEKRRIAKLRIFYRLRIMSPDRTIRYIAKKHCNIARYGDGEFWLVSSGGDLAFQSCNAEITEGLRNVLSAKRDNLLLCIPGILNSLHEVKANVRTIWLDWGRHGYHEKIVEMLRSYAGRGYRFGDSQITRPYIDWKTDKRAKRTFPKLKKLWAGRNILIVEGEQTRLGIGNDLFDNAKSIKRILCPALNAFEKRKEIQQAVINHYNFGGGWSRPGFDGLGSNRYRSGGRFCGAGYLGTGYWSY